MSTIRAIMGQPDTARLTTTGIPVQVGMSLIPTTHNGWILVTTNSRVTQSG